MTVTLRGIRLAGPLVGAIWQIGPTVPPPP